MSTEEMFDYLVENMIATKDEIVLVTNINGNNEQSFKDILFVKTGYRNFDQIMEEDC